MAINTVNGIVILHKRKDTASWAADTVGLKLGEFGIDTQTGEVRGYTLEQSGQTHITWDKATPLGSVEINLAEDNTVNTEEHYVYGLYPIKDETTGKTTYKLLRAKLPTVTTALGEESTSHTDTFITDIEVVKKQVDESDASKGYTYEVVWNTAPITPEHEVRNEGAFVTGTNATAAFVTNAELSDDDANNEHVLTRTFGQITAKSGSRITLTKNDSGVYEIGIDDEDYALAENLTGAMLFKGTIDLASIDNTTTKFDSKVTLKAGYSYKIITTDYTNAKSKTIQSNTPFHMYGTNELTEPVNGVHSATLEAGDMVVYINSDAALDSASSGVSDAHWCVIPSGEDPDGTVREVTIEEGLTVELPSGQNGNTITTTGKVRHVKVNTADAAGNTGPYTEIKYGNTSVAAGSGIVGNTVTTLSDVEVYDLVTSVLVDDKGHIGTVKTTQAKIYNEAHIKQFAVDALPDNVIEKATGEEVISVTPESTNITFTDGKNVTHTGEMNVYKISHKKVTNVTETGTTTSGHDQKYISEIITDGYGHITGYKTGKDQNTHRQINTIDKDNVQVTVRDTSSGSGAVTFVSGENINIVGSDSDGKITISTKGFASTSDHGFIKAASTEEDTCNLVQNDKGDQVSTCYGINVRPSDGLASVRVPNHIINQGSALTDSVARFATFKRDEWGHITTVTDITEIDGNPA